MLSAVVVHDEGALRGHREEWDALAEDRGSPYALSGWMLPWWRHVAPPEGRLTVVLVRDRGELVGVAPWLELRERRGLRSLRLLGTGHRVDPLAARGREEEVAEAIVAALAARGRPDLLRLERSDAGSPWPGLLARGWPLTGLVHRLARVPAPTLRTRARAYEDWLAGRSPNFRAGRRRARRRLEEAGARLRLVTADDDLGAAADALLRLHLARWQGRPTATSIGPRMGAMLREAVRELVPAGRLRLWLLEAEEGPVSAQLFVVAGGEAAYWNGGFDPAWAHLRPAFETLAAAVAHSFAAGDRRVDLGGGAGPYKLRLADGDEPIGPALVLPGGLDLPRRWALLVPERAGRAATATAKRLPPRLQEPLRRVRRRG